MDALPVDSHPAGVAPQEALGAEPFGVAPQPPVVPHRPQVDEHEGVARHVVSVERDVARRGVRQRERHDRDQPHHLEDARLGEGGAAGGDGAGRAAGELGVGAGLRRGVAGHVENEPEEGGGRGVGARREELDRRAQQVGVRGVVVRATRGADQQVEHVARRRVRVVRALVLALLRAVEPHEARHARAVVAVLPAPPQRRQRPRQEVAVRRDPEQLRRRVDARHQRRVVDVVADVELRAETQRVEDAADGEREVGGGVKGRGSSHPRADQPVGLPHHQPLDAEPRRHVPRSLPPAPQRRPDDPGDHVTVHAVGRRVRLERQALPVGVATE